MPSALPRGADPTSGLRLLVARGGSRLSAGAVRPPHRRLSSPHRQFVGRDADLATRTEIPIVLESVLQTARPSVLRQTFPEFTQPVADPEAPLNLFEQSAVLLAHPRQEVKMRGLTKAIAFAMTRRRRRRHQAAPVPLHLQRRQRHPLNPCMGLPDAPGKPGKDVISLATAPLNGKRNLDVRRCHQPSCPRPPPNGRIRQRVRDAG